MRERIDHRDVGPRAQRQVMLSLDMRRAHEVDAARIDDDEFRPVAQSPFHPRGKHGMRVGRIGADHEDDVALLDRLEVLRAGRRAKRLAQAVAGGRMADACAGVDVVVAEPSPHQLLHEKHFLVGAARGGDRADRVAAVVRPGCA